MTGNDTTVFILCGGRGSRLGARTKRVPKVLVPVNGRPILDHILDHFSAQGFRRFVLGTGYLSAQVSSFLKNRKSLVQPVVSNAGTEAGMLKRLYAARKHFGATVVVAYGDTFIDLDHRHLLRAHAASRAPVTIVTGRIRNPFGVVTLARGHRVRSFVEKPVIEYYIGCFAMQADYLEYVPADLIGAPDGEGIVGLFQRLVKQGRLHSFRHEGLQVTFNTGSELADAHRVLRDYYTMKENG